MITDERHRNDSAPEVSGQVIGQGDLPADRGLQEHGQKVSADRRRYCQVNLDLVQ